MLLTKVSRAEVMAHLDKEVLKAIPKFLKPIEQSWQPTDLLPEAGREDFFDRIRLLQTKAGGLSYDLLAVLIGDTITEEALPTYESWLSLLHPVKDESEAGWNQWVRAWTSEENRHGDVLNKYLYLCGRVNMKEMEISTQHLLTDGFDIGTARDPYRSFVYTSFQELATNLSHRRVAQFAKKDGDDQLARICGYVAADEARHANAYKSFVGKILEIDPSEMMLAFEDMMRRKIIMPAHNLREANMPKASAFSHFSDAAQRLGVYTANDYIDILKSLISEWKIETVGNLSEAGERAREYVLLLPDRLTKLAERMRPQPAQYQFSWINP